jgi:hypothetical protein
MRTKYHILEPMGVELVIPMCDLVLDNVQLNRGHSVSRPMIPARRSVQFS